MKNDFCAAEENFAIFRCQHLRFVNKAITFDSRVEEAAPGITFK